jgi:phage tail sheath protein FI
MAQRLMTPGVYIEEVNAFPGSVVEVATAVPAFIGYTEKASRNGKSLVNQPVRITSHAEYLQLFGGAFSPKFTLSILEGKPNKHQITVNGNKKAINFMTNHDLYMYRGIQLFFSNGGGTCYIVSVGTYEGKENGVEIKKDELEAGLETLLKEQEPTMVVIPDAVKLGDDCYDVYKKVLAHCAKMQSRVAILDIHNGDQGLPPNAPEDVILNFRELIGTEYLSYGTAYYPWLNTNIVQKGSITFENLADSEKLDQLLPDTEKDALALVTKFPKDNAGFIKNMIPEKHKELEALYESIKKEKIVMPVEPVLAVSAPAPFTLVDPKKLKDSATPEEKAAFDKEKDAFDKGKAEFEKNKADFEAKKAEFNTSLATYNTSKTAYETKMTTFLNDQSIKEVKKMLDDYIINKNLNYHQGLIATSPTYSNLLDEIRAVMNLLPPSSAMAGIYTMVDNNRGVWKSPANISLNSVLKPCVNITHDEQENLNVDPTSGKSINAIRTFPGIGTLVWGGRTLDGNSLDWKYINVRRTMIMLEQSIKMALRSYVFEPNDANTWVSVKSMIVNYLTEKWKQGALAGSSPEDAFDVQIGLGITMTGLDILEGRMLISVKLAIVRPAEFIVVRFEQQMQKS